MRVPKNIRNNHYQILTVVPQPLIRCSLTVALFCQ